MAKTALTTPTSRADWARENTRTFYIPHEVISETAADGTIRLRSPHPLPPSARNTGEWLHRWATERPESLAVSERTPSGEGWRDVSYGALLHQVRSVAAALLVRGLGPEDRIAILSGNSLNHLVLSLAAQYVGIPVAPLAEQYALIPEAHGRLIYVLNKLRPALVYVEDASLYHAAFALPQLAGCEVVATRGTAARSITLWESLLATPIGPEVDAAHAQVGPETLAKILFTSGSSSDPKGVLTTHGMMCVNQTQLAAALPFMAEKPPKITDWLPWNHVFGGSHNVNMMLYYGGTLTIDNGKPTAQGFPITLQNNRERPGSLMFNVPLGYSMMVKAAEADPDLRKSLFSDVDLIFYAGASLPQDVWERLEQFCLEVRGGLPLMISSWGLTETAPACLLVHEPIGRSGVIGVPVPGLEVKLIPDAEMRCEIRVRGPNITPGYFDDPEKTAAAFDEDGFFITGDAVRFVDPTDLSRGLIFDGRVSEDFKLDSGTWVQAGTLRLSVLGELRGLAQDVVICGHDRGEVGLLIFPLPDLVKNCEAVADGAITDPALMAQIETRLRAMNAHTSGSAKRITRAVILSDPPSLTAHEITDKGSLNVKKVLAHRAALLERLYDNEDPALIRV